MTYYITEYIEMIGDCIVFLPLDTSEYGMHQVEIDGKTSPKASYENALKAVQAHNNTIEPLPHQ